MNRECFTTKGIRLELIERPLRTVVQITVGRWPSIEGKLDIIWQPRDTNQWPVGPPRIVHTEEFHFSKIGDALSANVGLPEHLTFEQLRQCYFRLTPTKLRPPKPEIDLGN